MEVPNRNGIKISQMIFRIITANILLILMIGNSVYNRTFWPNTINFQNNQSEKSLEI